MHKHRNTNNDCQIDIFSEFHLKKAHRVVRFLMDSNEIITSLRGG